MTNNLDSRRLLVLVFCILAGLISLIAGIVKDVTFIGITVISMGSAILVVSERMKNWVLLFSKLLKIKVENEAEIIKPVAAVETINGVAAMAGSDPSIPGVILPPEVRAARLEIHKMLRTGLTGENAAKVLAFIDGLEPKVKKHWLIVSSRASMFVILCVFNEAEKIVLNAIAHPKCRQDTGMAYSVLAWITEVNTSSEDKARFEELLKLRTSYVEKGLAHFPERHALQMKGFEVYVLNKEAEKSVRHLMIAAQIDREFTQNKLREFEIKKPELLQLARSLSPTLNDLVERLLKKEKKQRMLGLVRTSQVASILLSVIVTVTALGAFFYSPAPTLNPFTKNNGVKIAQPGQYDGVFAFVAAAKAHDVLALLAAAKDHDVFALLAAAAKDHDVFALLAAAAKDHDVFALLTAAKDHDVFALLAAAKDHDVFALLAAARDHDVFALLAAAKAHDVLAFLAAAKAHDV